MFLKKKASRRRLFERTSRDEFTFFFQETSRTKKRLRADFREVMVQTMLKNTTLYVIFDVWHFIRRGKRKSH